MDWARAKTVLIALLLAVDVFLLVTYIRNENSTRQDELAIKEDVCRILAESGIEVDGDILPSDSEELIPASVDSMSDMKSCAEKLFGTVTENITTDGTEYSGEKGNVLVLSDSFSIVFDTEKKVNSEEDSESLAYSVARKLGVSTKKQKFETVAESGGYTVTIPQILSGVRVFGCDVTAKISAQGSIIAHGRFIADSELRMKDEKVLKTSALMLIFADEIEKNGYKNVKVKSVSAGYTASAPVSGRISLVPTLKFDFESDGEKTVYLNMTNGDLVNM